MLDSVCYLFYFGFFFIGCSMFGAFFRSKSWKLLEKNWIKQEAHNADEIENPIASGHNNQKESFRFFVLCMLWTPSTFTWAKRYDLRIPAMLLFLYLYNEL